MTTLISTPSRFGDASVEVYYGEQRLYPAPLISFARSTNRNDTDAAISTEDTWTLNGVYLNDPSGTYVEVVQGMDDLRAIFASDNLELTIRAGSAIGRVPSGTLLVSGVFPYVNSIGIPQRTDQFHRFDYEVQLTDKSPVTGQSGIENSSNRWHFSEEAQGTITKLTHNASAVGINTAVSGASSNALDNAKSFVDGTLGTANIPAGFPSYVFPGDVDGDNSTVFEFQRSRTEEIDVETGSYAVTEIFVYVSGAVPYSDSRNYQYNRDKAGVSTINIQGTVEGYPRSDNTDEPYGAFYNAQSGFTANIEPYIATEAAEVFSRWGGSGTLYTDNPISKGFTENRFLGTLGYSIQFTNDPKENLPSGIVEQSITVKRDESIRMFVNHTIPQRRLGNIFQDIATGTIGAITITASAKAENTGDAVADTNRALSHIQDLINQNRPSSADFLQLKITGQTQTPDKLNLTANAVVAYEFSVDLSTVPSADSDITLRPVT